MQKRLTNLCLIDLVIRTDGPLLVKSGLPGLSGPDMAPVVTFRNRPIPEPYIPGSSLKGVLRSHTERIARTLCFDPGGWRLGACDPFKAKKRERHWAEWDGACAVKFEERREPSQERKDAGIQPESLLSSTVYADSCPACKIYGSTSLISRFSVPDAYLLPGTDYRPERRDGVGIDRFTGGSSKGAKFDLEVITTAAFGTQLQLTNFELWQLGLLVYVLHDFSQGLVSIGSGKSRGLGQVKVEVRSMEIHQPTRGLPQRETPWLWGLHALESEEDRRAYGYWGRERNGVQLEGAASVPDSLGLRTTHQLKGEAVMRLWRKVAPLATDYLTDYQVPVAMRLGAVA